jgi:four helix bundle protein
MREGKKYGFEELVGWQKEMDLVDAVYDLTESWPRREKPGLTNQARRSAVSVPSNIAEGQGRKSNGDFARFLSIAYGSLMELRTQLTIGKRRKFSTDNDIQRVLNSLDEVGRLINGLKRSIT